MGAKLKCAKYSTGLFLGYPTVLLGKVPTRVAVQEHVQGAEVGEGRRAMPICIYPPRRPPR